MAAWHLVDLLVSSTKTCSLKLQCLGVAPQPKFIYQISDGLLEFLLCPVPAPMLDAQFRGKILVAPYLLPDGLIRTRESVLSKLTSGGVEIQLQLLHQVPDGEAGAGSLPHH